jgi:hypothetical protein
MMDHSFGVIVVVADCFPRIDAIEGQVGKIAVVVVVGPFEIVGSLANYLYLYDMHGRSGLCLYSESNGHY